MNLPTTSNSFLKKFVVISGCSGGGKSTLLDALASEGCRVVEEPGRRIVASELASGGAALPWKNAEAFARRAIEMSLSDLADQSNSGQRVFFDRGLIDAASAASHISGDPIADILNGCQSFSEEYRRLYGPVFLAPPWPEIYVTDDERRHGFSQAVEEYVRLNADYAALGFDVHILAKASVGDRLKQVLAMV